MQFISGRISFIGEKNVVSKGDYSFFTLVFAIKKRMDDKKRHICFECAGKVAEKISKLNLDEKIEVKYLIDSTFKNGRWFTALKAKDVEVLNQNENKQSIQQLNLKIWEK